MNADIVPLSSLETDGRNANKGTERGRYALERSLEKLGAGRSILLDKNGKIIAGNKTAETAGEMGIEDVVIVRTTGDKLVAVMREDLDLDEVNGRARELAYADNRVGQLDLEFDPAAIVFDLEAGLDLSDWWKEDELTLLTADIDGMGGVGETADADGGVSQTEAERIQERWQVKPGQTWQLGGHRVACIDCLDEAAVIGFIDGRGVGLVWADPPYGIDIVAANGYVGGGEAYDIPFGGVKNKTKKRLGSVGGVKLAAVGKYEPVIGDSTTQTAVQSSGLCLSLFPDAFHVWWGGNYYADSLPARSCWLVWDKQNTGNFSDCELAWTNSDRAVRIFRHMWNGMLKDSERGERRVHPTQKPVALAAWAFEKYGSPGDVIFDPFLGSGISVLAAEQLKDGRAVYGCELSPAYIAVTIQRWADATGLTPELVP